MRFLRTNTAVRVTVGPFFDKTDGITPETAITVTSCKLTLMVDDANVPTLVLDTNPTASGGANDMVHVTGDDAGFYDLELAAANVNYLGRAMLAITDAATHCPVFHEFMILPAMIYDSMVLGTDRLDTNVTHVGDTAQTARDLGASVLLSSGTGTGQLDFTSGVVKANLAQILGTALTETAGQIAAGFKKVFDVAAPVFTAANVNQTGDSYARLGAPAGASVSADVAAVKSDTGALVTRIPAALFSGITSLAQWLGIMAGRQTGNTTARTEIRATGAGSGTYDETTDSLEANRDNLGTNGAALSLAKTTNITGFNDVSAAQVNTEADTALSDYGALKPTTAGRTLDVSAGGEAGIDLANIGSPTTVVNLSGTTIKTATDVEADTQDLQGRLPAALTGSGNIKSEEQVKTGFALTSAYDPAKTAAQAGDAMALTSGERTTLAGVIWDRLTSAITTVGSIGKQLKDNIDAAISSRLASGSYTAPPSAAEVADQVWEEALADHSGTSGSTAAALNAAGSAGDPWNTALPGSYGSGTAGKIIGDNLNATVSSRATQTSVDDLPTNAELATALAGADDAVLAAIAALNNLSQANIRTAIGLTSANLDTQLADLPTNAELATALAAADDAVLAAIAALNNLSQANIRTAVGLASANLDTQLDALPTNAELATALASADDAVLAAIAALNNLSAAQVKTQVVAGLATDTYAEPAAVPAATASLVDKIGFLTALALNRQTLNNDTGLATLRNAGNTADIGTRTDSDNGTEYVKGTWS